MKEWCQAFALKLVNLYRYTAVGVDFIGLLVLDVFNASIGFDQIREVGLYTLTPPDP